MFYRLKRMSLIMLCIFMLKHDFFLLGHFVFFIIFSKSEHSIQHRQFVLFNITHHVRYIHQLIISKVLHYNVFVILFFKKILIFFFYFVHELCYSFQVFLNNSISVISMKLLDLMISFFLVLVDVLIIF